MIPGVQRAVDDLREYFTLARAEERAQTISNETLATVRADLLLSIQRREAAELLWQGEARAEALRLARDAWSLLDRHTEGVITKPRVADISLPRLEEELTEDHREHYAALIDAQLHYQRAFASVVLDRRQRHSRRAVRIIACSAALVVTLCLVVSWARKVEMTAEASGFWGPMFAPAQAVDGNEATHWLLPDKSAGWLDVKLASPRRISTVSILNGYDPPTYSTADYRVEAYVGGVLVRAVDATFSPGTGKQPWADVSMAVDRPIDRVRIVVKTFRGIGGSLAEVKVR